MHRTHLFALALPPIVGTLLITSAARSADLVVAGTPEQEGVVVGNGIHQGLQLEGNVGTGFNDPYPFGFGGRVGYTTGPGIYLGANGEHFMGSNAAGSPQNTLVGGEAGLKIFPTYHLEVRPYAFAGAEVPSNANTQFAFGPGAVAAYHFGPAFVDVDGRYLMTPSPTTFLLLGGGAGLGF